MRAAWLSVLADAAGVDEAWLAGELERVGAPVESVRMRDGSGGQPSDTGLTLRTFKTWREGLGLPPREGSEPVSVGEVG